MGVYHHEGSKEGEEGSSLKDVRRKLIKEPEEVKGKKMQRKEKTKASPVIKLKSDVKKFGEDKSNNTRHIN